MGEFVDQHLLGFAAQEKALKQPRRIRIGRVLEYPALHNDKGRPSKGRRLPGLALILEQNEAVVVAVGHDGAFLNMIFLGGSPATLSPSTANLSRCGGFAREHESGGQDGAAVARMALDDLAVPFRVEQVGVTFRGILVFDQVCVVTDGL